MYVRVIALLGYFFLDDQVSSFPKRKARWGHLVHGVVESQAEAETFAEGFRDFLLAGSTHLVQMDRLSMGTLTALDTSKPATEQAWSWSTLYDHGGQLYPSTGYGEPHWGWVRGTGYPDYPLPPFIALRYRRTPSTAFSGRQHYGYCRTVRCGFGNFGGTWMAGYAPFVPVGLSGSFSHHVAQSLTLSGFDGYHGSGLNKEIMLYFREGGLHEIDCIGYEQDIATTTSRNFYIN